MVEAFHLYVFVIFSGPNPWTIGSRIKLSGIAVHPWPFFLGGGGGGGGGGERFMCVGLWLFPSKTIDQIGPKILGLLCGCRRWFNFEWEVTVVVFSSMNQIIPNFQGSLDLCRRIFFRPLHGHLSTNRPKSFPMIGHNQSKVLAQKIQRASRGVPD